MRVIMFMDTDSCDVNGGDGEFWVVYLYYLAAAATVNIVVISILNESCRFCLES